MSHYVIHLALIALAAAAGMGTPQGESTLEGANWPESQRQRMMTAEH